MLALMSRMMMMGAVAVAAAVYLWSVCHAVASIALQLVSVEMRRRSWSVSSFHYQSIESNYSYYYYYCYYYLWCLYYCC